MPNEITSLLQPLASQPRVPGQVRNAAPTAATEKTSVEQVDRVTLSDSARLLQRDVNKTGRDFSQPSGAAKTDVSQERAAAHKSADPNRLPVAGSAQRPSPAVANMLQAFFTTSGTEGFDPNSDLNADGVINFHDLAALRDIEAGIGTPPQEKPDASLIQMTESFLTTEGSEGFDAASDLNGDGIINFHDLAALRSKMEDG